MPELTDDEMDARLRDAGARWREAIPAAPDTAAGDAAIDITPGSHRPRRARTWIAALSGAALVAAAVVIAIAATRGGGQPPGPAGRPELSGTSWVASVAQPLFTGATNATITFAADGAVAGSDGCNSFSGPVDIQATRLVLGDLTRTEMACPTTQPAADLIDRVLAGRISWTISRGQLILTKPGVGSITYTPKPPRAARSTDPKDLAGVTWGLSGVEYDAGNSASGSGSSNTTAVTLTFTGSGGYRVSEPCRVTTGRVQLGTGSANFDNRLGQAYSCTDAAADPSTMIAVDMVLSTDTTWSISDGTLAITNGSITLTLTDHPTSDQPSSTGADPSTLLGTTWLLADVTSPGFHGTIDRAKSKLKLIIDQAGSLTIDDGVNSHSVPDGKPVDLRPDTIVVGALSSTLVGCGPVGADNTLCARAAVLAKFFGATIGWAIHNGRLTLTHGDTTLVYVPA